MKAKHKTTCSVCQTTVWPGDPIGVLRSGRWGHEACAESARNKALINGGYTYAGRAPVEYRLKPRRRD